MFLQSLKLLNAFISNAFTNLSEFSSKSALKKTHSGHTVNFDKIKLLEAVHTEKQILKKTNQSNKQKKQNPEISQVSYKFRVSLLGIYCNQCTFKESYFVLATTLNFSF